MSAMAPTSSTERCRAPLDGFELGLELPHIDALRAHPVDGALGQLGHAHPRRALRRLSSSRIRPEFLTMVLQPLDKVRCLLLRPLGQSSAPSTPSPVLPGFLLGLDPLHLGLRCRQLCHIICHAMAHEGMGEQFLQRNSNGLLRRCPRRSRRRSPCGASAGSPPSRQPAGPCGFDDDAKP